MGLRILIVVAAPLLAVAAVAWAAAQRAAPNGEALLLGTRATCDHYAGRPPGWPQSPTAGMVSLRLNGKTRWIDATEVTQAQFADFVAATGYVTDAERGGDTAVFVQQRPDDSAPAGPDRWWQARVGANWRQPKGPAGASPQPHDPVSMVTRADAQAYARWRGNRLPTESEWQAAALDHHPRDLPGAPTANFWQGLFPLEDRGEDGFRGVAPVGCFSASDHGLYDTIGNLWEWTADEYDGRYQSHGHGEPLAASSPEVGVIKGGSWLCAANWCQRYRAGARHPQDAGLATVHVGFRTFRD